MIKNYLFNLKDNNHLIVKHHIGQNRIRKNVQVVKKTIFSMINSVLFWYMRNNPLPKLPFILKYIRFIQFNRVIHE